MFKKSGTGIFQEQKKRLRRDRNRTTNLISHENSQSLGCDYCWYASHDVTVPPHTTCDTRPPPLQNNTTRCRSEDSQAEGPEERSRSAAQEAQDHYELNNGQIIWEIHGNMI